MKETDLISFLSALAAADLEPALAIRFTLRCSMADFSMLKPGYFRVVSGQQFRSGDAARDFAFKFHVGMVGIKVPIPVPIAYYTFGGWRGSGFGDLNQHGPNAFKFYTKTKTVTARWPSGIKDGAGFVIPTMR